MGNRAAGPRPSLTDTTTQEPVQQAVPPIPTALKEISELGESPEICPEEFGCYIEVSAKFHSFTHSIRSFPGDHYPRFREEVPAFSDLNANSEIFALVSFPDVIPSRYFAMLGQQSVRTLLRYSTFRLAAPLFYRHLRRYPLVTASSRLPGVLCHA